MKPGKKKKTNTISPGLKKSVRGRKRIFSAAKEAQLPSDKKKSSGSPDVKDNSKLKTELAKRTLELDAKNRALEIEVALEKVRARTMAMRKSDELPETSLLLYEQLKALGEPSEQLTIGVFNEEKGIVEISATIHGNKVSSVYDAPLDEPLVMRPLFRAWKTKKKSMVIDLSGHQLTSYNKYRKKIFLAHEKLHLFQKTNRWVVHATFFSRGVLTFSTNTPRPTPSLKLLERFATVFDLVYTRFLDLQKAEAQAREAQIEVALEKVRSRAMAMRTSGELSETSSVLFQELKKLEIKTIRSGFGIFNDLDKTSQLWLTTEEENKTEIKVIGTGDASAHFLFDEFYKVWKEKRPFCGIEVAGDALKHYYAVASTLINVPVPKIYNEREYYYCFYFGEGTLNVITIQVLLEEELQILLRFAKVFGLLYKRFIDLQKAEAQAREAQIEAALEKVRSRSLAMHRSEELQELVAVVLEKLRGLDVRLSTANIITPVNDSLDANVWVAAPGQSYSTCFRIPPSSHAISADISDARLKGEVFLAKTYSKEEKNEYYRFLFENTDLRSISEERKEFILSSDFYSFSVAAEGEVGIQIVSFTEAVFTEKENEILKRFAKVFGQAYTRFLDLLKAEAQAREAQIEAALEKVRAQSLAMHKSEELTKVVAVLFEKLQELEFGIDKGATSLVTFVDGSNDHIQWIADASQAYATPFYIPFTDHLLSLDLLLARKSGTENVSKVYTQEQKNDYFKYLFQNTEYRTIPEHVQEMILSAKTIAVTWGLEKHTAAFVTNADGKPLSEKQTSILKRFSKVFEQSYTRFLDLKKAEAQAREAQTEASLERVRARTMAMHNSSELDDVVALLYQELKKLNKELDRAVIMAVDPQTLDSKWWMASGDDTQYKSGLLVQHNQHPSHVAMLEGWKERREKWEYILGGQEKMDWDKYLFFETELVLLPEEVKSFMMSVKTAYLSSSFQNFGCLSTGSLAPLTADTFDLLARFSKVFEITYTRFLDLQKAEAQAREAQIEAALESVRASSMAMHRSSELEKVVKTLSDKLIDTGLSLDGALILFFNKEKRDFHLWIATNHLPAPIRVNMPYDEDIQDNPIIRDLWSAIDTGGDFINKSYTGQTKDDYFRFVGKHNEATIPEAIRKFELETEIWTFSFTGGKHAVVGVDSWSGKVISPEEFVVLKRFAGVFEQAYTRFLDLQKAEAQAREAHIEAALEKVRSASLAMHHSEELEKVTVALFDQLAGLGLAFDGAFITTFDDEKKSMREWVATHAPPDPAQVVMPYDVSVEDNQIIKDLWNSKRKCVDTNNRLYSGKEKNDFFAYVGKYNESNVPENIKKLHQETDWMVSWAAEKNCLVGLDSWSGHIIPEADFQILKRFSKVFEQAYTRFLDLQKAEAQAREAQIEAALERVRARTMAMHDSAELVQTAELLFHQLKLLGAESQGVAFAICDRESPIVQKWTSIGNFSVPCTFEPGEQRMYEAWKNQEKIYEEIYEGEALRRYYELFAEIPVFKAGVQKLIDSGFPIPTWQKNHAVIFKHGYLLLILTKPFPETRIFIRFAKVFEQTYTRFLDLQKAEAQAHEAQIEAALERVRSRAMAIRKTDELRELIGLVFKEFKKLGFGLYECNLLLFDSQPRDLIHWGSGVDDSEPNKVKVPYYDHPFLNELFADLDKGVKFRSGELSGENLKSFLTYLFTKTEFKNTSSEYQAAIMSNEQLFFTHSVTSHGFIEAVGSEPLSEERNEILRRFTRVVDLAYTRFIDVANAETQAREAVKQASLDRVRAEIASMRTTQDLNRITPLIWRELTTLGVPFVRCGVFIMDEGHQLIHTFLSTPDGKAIAAFHLPYQSSANLKGAIDSWHVRKPFAAHWSTQEFQQQADVLIQQGTINTREQYLNLIPTEGIHLHFLPFMQGMLYVGHTSSLNEEDLQLVQSVADAFSTAYARYEDFNKLEAAKQQVEQTLTDLKQAQQRLVQSEKMASLGELTAGIAHEIQNPLNFVNNFSDVSKELLDEMKLEMKNGNAAGAASLAKDVIENLEKITFHGKRADAIVKSMLQHSRKSTGQKEQTDINALCDEYLRLSYHGLRAKDKSFNAKFETDFDSTLPTINVVPQEIGRVILNLINNAFYTVSEKAKLTTNYQPQVTVSTRKLNGKIEIQVKDNGTGVPENVKDKIFQPFFTTKPTGQGTGLGLSLAYDIITKGHDGELKIETKEGIGSEFIIQLPNR